MNDEKAIDNTINNILESLSGPNVDDAFDSAKLQKVQLHESKNYNELEGLAAYGWILQHTGNQLTAINKINNQKATIIYHKSKYILTVDRIVYGLEFDTIDDINVFHTKLNAKLLFEAKENNVERLATKIHEELL